LTIPNLVGYARLAGIPVFLYLALRSGDGRTAPAVILYLAIAAGDYLDVTVKDGSLVMSPKTLVDKPIEPAKQE